jgi:uncharacterized damage-inducible protein DinB
MAISQALLPEFDMEMANVRRTLERVPDGKFDWKPHEKSMTMGRLAAHLANIPTWGKLVMEMPALDVNPPGGSPIKQPELHTRQELLNFFDKHVPETRAALAAADDRSFLETWTLENGGKTIFSMPRMAAIRGMVMNHVIHHRAQMGVYLRLNDIPVPSIYGPSADEGRM